MEDIPANLLYIYSIKILIKMAACLYLVNFVEKRVITWQHSDARDSSMHVVLHRQIHLRQIHLLQIFGESWIKI